MAPNKPHFQQQKRRWLLLVLLLMLTTSACSTYQSDEDFASGDGESSESEFDTAEPEADSLTQDEDKDEGTTSSESGLTTFHGYLCTVDCSGHEAGYEWAEEKGISDPDDCGGNSESFIEGCRAYAGEEGPHVGEMNEEDSSDEEEFDDEESDEEDE